MTIDISKIKKDFASAKPELVLVSLYHAMIYPILMIVTMKVATYIGVELSSKDFILGFAGAASVNAFFERNSNKNKFEICLEVFVISFFLAYFIQFFSKISYIFFPLTVAEICGSIIFIIIYTFIYYHAKIDRYTLHGIYKHSP